MSKKELCYSSLHNCSLFLHLAYLIINISSDISQFYKDSSSQTITSFRFLLLLSATLLTFFISLTFSFYLIFKILHLVSYYFFPLSELSVHFHDHPYCLFRFAFIFIICPWLHSLHSQYPSFIIFHKITCFICTFPPFAFCSLHFPLSSFLCMFTSPSLYYIFTS